MTGVEDIIEGENINVQGYYDRIDLAKRVFRLHGKRDDEFIIFRKKLMRAQLLAIAAQHPRCVVAMEPCGMACGRSKDNLAL